MAEEHHFKTIAEVAPLIRDRRLTATDLLESQIERIERLDGGLKAYATVMSRHAREQARAADVEIGAGRYRGALHGVPVAVKDLCDTAGVRTMGGCAVLADHVPAFDVEAVDTVAAGDAFGGALGVALAEGRDLAAAVRFASAAGAVAVTRPGAQAAMPSRDEVESLLRSRPEEIGANADE